MVQPNMLNPGSPITHHQLCLLATFFLSLSACVPTTARTYYIAPSGNDVGGGTSASPWKTFAFAIPKLNPGDTLLLKDGTYTRGTTGMPAINCSFGAGNGTASAPITIQAENERRAWLKGDGTTTVLRINNCSYWNVVGLRASDADNTSGGSFFLAMKSDHINFRRNLLSNSNRKLNQSMITYNNAHYGVIEENELYDYTRHGFLLAHTSNVVVRRNYANSRDYTDNLRVVPGVYNTGQGGDSLVAVYPGSDNLAENNISERNGAAFSIQASGSGGAVSSNNKFFGNISLSDGAGGGLRIRTRQNSLTGMAQNTYIENQVVIHSRGAGGDFRANKNTLCTNTSIFNGQNAGFLASTPEFVGDGASTITIKNSLAVSNKFSGFGSINYSVFTLSTSNAFGNGTDYSPDSLASGNMSIDPQLGSCKVFIPDGSPMKGAGANGDDIGANVLCRYENGTLTQTQLWNWSTGQFPCGAIVPGVNDKPGESCFDVNQRLNVNANGCSLPANPVCKQPAPPNSFPPLGGVPPGDD